MYARHVRHRVPLQPNPDATLGTFAAVVDSYVFQYFGLAMACLVNLAGSYLN